MLLIHLCHGILLIFLAESILYLLVLQSVLGMFIARLIVWLISWPIELVLIRLVNGFWANGDLPSGLSGILRLDAHETMHVRR